MATTHTVWGWRVGQFVGRIVSTDLLEVCVDRVIRRVLQLTPEQRSLVCHWRDDYSALYIGRRNAHHGFPESKWHNPYRLEEYGGDTPVTRQRCIEAYAAYLIQQEALMAALPELAGRKLGCWCRHAGKEVPCHGLVLVALALTTPMQGGATQELSTLDVTQFPAWR